MKSGAHELEVFNNQFQMIVNEMATGILRTGHTVFVKQTGDFGAALASTDGEIFAAPTNIGSLRMVGNPLHTALAASHDVNEGDVFLSNDPDSTGGMATHLPDLYVWRPIFVAGELIAWAWAFVHVTDLGGKVPGSISPTSAEMFQEGIIIPPMKLVDSGAIDLRLWSLLEANSRIGPELLGDVEALLAGLEIAERRVRDLCERHGVDRVTQAIADVLSYAEHHARQLITAMPDGRYEFWDYAEGPIDGAEPIRIRVALRIAGELLELDFTGTDPDVLNAYNLPTKGQRVHHFVMSAIVNYFRSLRPGIPYNSGMLRNVAAVLPPGSILNPRPRAAVGVRAATLLRLYDTVLGAMCAAVPSAIPAAGSGQCGILTVAVPDTSSGGTRVSVVQVLIGGSGARPLADGIDGMDVCGGNLRNIPIEVIETELPLRVEHYALLADTGGAGLNRGGVGISFELRCLAPQVEATCRGLDRYRFRPYGVQGGDPGSLGATIVNGDVGIGRFDVLELGYGDVVQFVCQGGGGFGDPNGRDPERVLRDVHNGLVSTEKAKQDYGVVLNEKGIDEAATVDERLRRGARESQFSFGVERDAFELTNTDAARTAYAVLMCSLKPFERDYLRKKLRPDLNPNDLERVAAELLLAVGITMTKASSTLPQEEGDRPYARHL